ncbi:MAG: hypothetical protein AAGN35_28175 [Bacteroidota bacterium]
MNTSKLTAIKRLQFIILLLVLGCAHDTTERESLHLAERKGAFAPFVPIVELSDFGSWVPSLDLLKDTAYVNRQILTLAYYGVPALRSWDSTGFKILVADTILEKEEYCYNMTIKALDIEWFQGHVGRCSN